MAFEIEQTGIEGLVFIKAFFSEDMRGYYKKVFERERFESVGLPTQFFEFSDIRSRRGVVRGLHYQDRHSQGKLLHVVSGRIYDVALDLREQSCTEERGGPCSSRRALPMGSWHWRTTRCLPISVRTTTSRTAAAVSCGTTRTWPSPGRSQTASS